MNGRAEAVVATGLAVLAPVLTMVIRWIYGHRVPDPLLSDWRGASTVDGAEQGGDVLNALQDRQCSVN